MDKLAQMVAMGAAGAAGAAGPLSVEDVFSTYLYTGNDTDTDIVNGIDLAGNGGLVWIKSRQAAYGHRLIDSEVSLSTNKYLDTSSTSALFSGPVINSFNSDGFNLDSNWYGNSSDPLYGGNFASWTFRKAPGFFDVVTFSTGGTLSTSRAISHGLGSAPGFVIIKSTTTAQNWLCYHRSLGQSSYIPLNLTQGQNTTNQWWTATPPTSTDFYLNETLLLNINQSYVAYLFAHDEAVFGENEDQSIISCGSFTGNSSSDGPEVNLGWEPQWVLVKPYTGTRETSSWRMYDVMRGITAGPSSNGDLDLQPNSDAAEGSQNYGPTPTPTGFKIEDNNLFYNDSGTSYIYVAIRRGPMRTPTDATEVFNASLSAINTNYTTGFVPDLAWTKSRTNNLYSWFVGSRMTGPGYMAFNDDSAEQSGGSWPWDNPTNTFYTSEVADGPLTYMFGRAPGFLDIVTYKGNGQSSQTIPHNLGVVPEFVVTKRRNAQYGWFCQDPVNKAGGYITINSSGQYVPDTAAWANTDPTSTHFTVGNYRTNNSGNTYIAYLFATVAGVSKVGTYTGASGDLNIDCGFNAGARFVLIKQIDSGGGDWYVWNSTSGIVAGNDPYVLLNSKQTEDATQDYIDPYSSGFTVTVNAPADLKTNGATYIFLAIA